MKTKASQPPFRMMRVAALMCAAAFAFLAWTPNASAQEVAPGVPSFATTAKAQLLQYRQERAAAESRRYRDYDTSGHVCRNANGDGYVCYHGPMGRAFAGQAIDPGLLSAWAGWFYVEVGEGDPHARYIGNLEDSLSFVQEKADANTVTDQDMRVIGRMMDDWRQREQQALRLYDAIAGGCRDYWLAKKPGYYFDPALVQELANLWLPGNESWRTAQEDPLVYPDPLGPLVVTGLGLGLLTLSKGPKSKKTAADFAKDIRDAKRKFEDLQRDLQTQTNGVLDRLNNFNEKYNAQFDAALHDLSDYAKTYQKIVPDIQEILDTASDYQLGKKIANWSDTVLAIVGAVGGGVEGLLGGAEGENAALRAAQEAEDAMAGARELPPLPPDGPLPPEFVEPYEPPLAPVQPEPPPPVKPGAPVTLEPGAAGNEQLAKIMDGYTPTQNKIYAETINQMKQDMVNGTFDWSKSTQPIQLDGNIIVDGHHRLIAAQMAAAETGRPLYGAANAIIPEGGMVNGSLGARTTTTWGGKEIGGIGVKAGEKPTLNVPSLGDDPVHMQELKDIQDMSGPETED